MSEKHDQPAFDKIVPPNEGVIAVNNEYLLQPQGRICDLLPDEWLAARGSVFFDQATRQIVVDTFDPPRSTVAYNELPTTPFVARLVSPEPHDSRMVYAVDMRRVHSYNYPSANVRLDDEFNTVFEQRSRIRGAAIAQVAIVRFYNEIHYLGPEEFIEPTERFVQSVDEYVMRLDRRKIPLQQPFYSDRFATFHDIESQELFDAQHQDDTIATDQD